MSVESLLEQQLLLAEKIKKSYINFKKQPKEKRTLGYLEGRMELLQQNWKAFQNTHSTIFAAVSSEERKTNEYFSHDVYEVEEVYESMYISIKEHIQILQQQLQTQQVQTQQSQFLEANIGAIRAIGPTNASEVRLPRIKIESFSGNYENWVSFRNLYTALVHDKAEYTAVEKFYYLKANLSGEASRLINQYTITSENYVAAWDTLIKRYDNKRILVNTAIRNLMSYPKILFESSIKIKNLLDVVSESLHSLHGLEINTDTWAPILIYILVQKLDAETGRLWEYSLKAPREIPKVDAFLKFLEGRFQALENIGDNNKHKNSSEPFKPKTFNNSRSSSSSNQQSTSLKCNSFHGEISKGCIICNKSHRIFNCPKFSKASPETRKQLIKRHMGCFNCLQRHQEGQCPVTSGCKKCGQMHSTLLHSDTKTSNQFATTIDKQTISNSVQEAIPSTSSSVLSHASMCSSPQRILLATALVHVKTCTGTHILRCLLDQGSESSFITTAAVQRLGLKKTPIVASVLGIAATQSTLARHIVELEIKSRYNLVFKILVEALVLPSITGKLPSTTVHHAEWPHINDINLADPQYHQTGNIDMLLGADIYGAVLLTGLRKGPTGSPVAQNTEFGWILSGPVNMKQKQSSTFVHSFHQRYVLDEQIKKLWLLDEISNKRENTQEENECEQHFLKTFRRTSDGRFLVRLPFKSNDTDSPLGESRDQAVSRFLHLERKFKKNPILYEEYKGVINDYSNQKHMVTINACQPAAYYMPHHAVIKEHSSTSRLRVVFDASAKTTSGTSLNDKLLIGPTIQDDLVSILMRWRTHLIVFSADITKMYRQIRVHPADTQFQRIIWRDHPKEKLNEFELQTVTFGTAPASFLAIRCLQQLAHEQQKSQKSRAAEIILSDFYVDDLMTGANTLSEAITLKTQITNILHNGGFELRKFVSNNQEFLAGIPVLDREAKLPLPIGIDGFAKTLGMNYHPAGDCFCFKVAVQTSPNNKPTKRSLLSTTAKLFDPLGWLAPVIITAKIMFQELWLLGLDWDQDLPQPLSTKWASFVSELHYLEHIKIPRSIRDDENCEQVQLHGFCDASQSAYAAVVYARVVTKSSIKVTMLASKTRVAPIKPISIPRLELCGAFLLATLMENVIASLRVINTTSWAWTDSTIVLGWLRGHPSKYKTFVANRVVEIHESLGVSCWRHVKTDDNPADSATRGILPSELQNFKIWWHGPEWLSLPESSWCAPINVEQTSLELKTPSVNALHTTSDDDDQLLSRYSTLTRLLRVTAWCLRFAQNCKNISRSKISGNLTAAEIKTARATWLRKVQMSAFHIEYEHLKNKKILPKTSKILTFNPFIDDSGTLRVGGRLRNSTLTYEEKHPAILPPKNKLTLLFINHAHKYTLHGGVQTTMAFLRRHVWIIRGRNEVRKCIHKCVKCFRFRASGTEQIMGDLPASRIQVSVPFTNVGVDYAGPLDIRASGGRNIKTYKGYIALFICLATKAVHLEAVSEQTSTAFLAAFNRFVARRGLPANVYSDNGTNFVGANRHLQEYRKASQQIANQQVNDGVQWHFIPPRSPHFGGLWEAGIKSTKGHLKKIVGNSVLTFEELTTILAQIEACLNSRPLCPMTSDHQDLSALTPGHFLVGRPLIAPPNTNLNDMNINRLRRWKQLDKLHQDFWKRWSTEYLSRLQQRPKWVQPKDNIKVGDLVLLKEDNQPPLHWPLGRVVKAIPGKDNRIRVVELLTSTGTWQRCINKVCLLPIMDNYEDANKL